MSLTRFFSLLCRPSASGSTQTTAASKQADFSVSPLGHVLAYRLPHLRRKQRVKWKSAAAEPKMVPNLGTSHAHELNAFVTLLVEISSKMNLRIAKRRMLTHLVHLRRNASAQLVLLLLA